MVAITKDKLSGPAAVTRSRSRLAQARRRATKTFKFFCYLLHVTGYNWLSSLTYLCAGRIYHRQLRLCLVIVHDVYRRHSPRREAANKSS